MNHTLLNKLGLLALLYLTSLTVVAQQTVSLPATASTVPRLISFNGVLKDAEARAVTRITGATFLIYKDEQGGAPLWLETQNIRPDSAGRYSVQLGMASPHGLPAEIFLNGEGRWLAVQIGTEPEQRRILLVAVPYAIKAADAETVGGLPPSAFVLAAPVTGRIPGTERMSDSATPALPPTAGTVTTTTGGTANAIPMFTTGTNVENSILTQTSTTAINVGGKLILPATSTATATGGKASQPNTFVASAFNSGTSTAVNQKFQWQAEPVGNNTSTASGSLNLLFAQGTSAPAETGLNIASNGRITFASGQAFPGTGTVTAVTAGTDLTGGGTSGAVTLNLDTTQVPRLASANNFTANQNVTGNVVATGTVSGGVVNTTSSFNIGTTVFAFGSTATANTFLGFAGNPGSTGVRNTGVGLQALSATNSGGDNTAIGSAAMASNTLGFENTATGASSLRTNTSGNRNTADGAFALTNNTTGSGNTALGDGALGSSTASEQSTAVGKGALQLDTEGINNTAIGAEALNNTQTGNSDTGVGAFALSHNTNGGLNTALGFSAGPDSGNLTNTTAIGSGASVHVSNAMVLGSINGVNGATADTFVGIGTVSPTHKLHIGIGNNTFRVEGPTAGTVNGILASFGGSGDFRIDKPGTGGGRLVVKDSGFVGIGTTAPDRTLSVNGTADKVGGSWDTFSDRRLKTVNGNFESGLSQLLQLNPIRYRYKKENALGIQDSVEHVGFVAQEVQKVIPEAVSENSKGYLLVNNDPILWTMLNAIKEQQQQIRTQQRQLATQQAELIRVNRKMELLETTLRNPAHLSKAVKTSQSVSRAATSGPGSGSTLQSGDRRGK